MRCEGYELPADVEAGALAWIRANSGFQAGQLQSELLRLGVPQRPVRKGYDTQGPSHRLTDRLLQRERKRGTIEFRRGLWYKA